MRSLSGIQPSGRLHLGNYYGALRQFLELQEQGEALYFLADLHALTTVRDGERLRALTREAAAGYLALGLDPSRAVLFRQSDVPEVCELSWILGTVVPLSNLERAHGYKDKLAHGLGADMGLFAYPVLMAADILVYGSDVVPVGKDQLQHLEFTRDWAGKFNSAYVPGYDPADPEGREPGHAPGILKLPRAHLREDAAVVPGTDGEKMSKSRGNTIDLFAEDGEVRKAIMGIRTDSTPVEAPKPAGGALHQLLRLVLPGPDFQQVEASWLAGGTGYGEYKKRLLEVFHAAFDGARLRYRELVKDPGPVEKVLEDGARRARALAAPVMESVRRAVGLR